LSRWFRFYDDAVNDPKLLRLSDAMHRAWTTLLCIASKNDGVLPPLTDVALMLRLKPAKVAEWLAVLTAGGLFDNNEGVFSPHNWNSRQYKSDVSNERVKRYRERKCNVTPTVTVTPPETEQKQITETEQRKGTRASALAAPWVAADRDRFWEAFPNKVGKADALKAFDKASHKTTPEVLFPALDLYARKTDDRPFCNPATWLNQERWLDKPAGNTNGRRTVQQAADDLLTTLRSFDEPAPDGLRDREGQDVVRLLPSR
jgi:hypothetical protein